MFFAISKILSFAIKPVVWIIGLLFYAVWTRRPWRGRRAVVAALALLLLSTNRWITNEVVCAWEPETLTANQIQEPYDIGIVLGGYSNLFITPAHDRYNFSERANRFTQALELYRSGKVKKLLFTGGTGRLMQDGGSEAALLPPLLEKLGIPPTDVILEERSRNTWENAVFTREIIEARYPGASCLLITSAAHMPRSAACFQKAGLAVIPFAVDYMSEEPLPGLDLYLLPDKTGLYKWEWLIKEWIGCVAYRLRGYN